MIPFTKKKRIFLYLCGILLAGISVPLGNAVRDWGIIHTVGIVILLFVGAGLFWEFFGSDRPDRKNRD
jgi:hypothetical protein